MHHKTALLKRLSKRAVISQCDCVTTFFLEGADCALIHPCGGAASCTEGKIML